MNPLPGGTPVLCWLTAVMEPPCPSEPQTLTSPVAVSAANARRDAEMAVCPLPLGTPVPPLPPSPQARISPSAVRAANAASVETITTNPAPVGAPVPPALLLPQARIWPSTVSTANASLLAKLVPPPAVARGPPGCPTGPALHRFAAACASCGTAAAALIFPAFTMASIWPHDLPAWDARRVLVALAQAAAMSFMKAALSLAALLVGVAVVVVVVAVVVVVGHFLNPSGQFDELA